MTASHVPVLLDRVVALLAPALDPRRRRPGRRDPRPRRPQPRRCSAACELARVVGIDRDPRRPRAGRRAAGAVRRPLHRRARGLRRDPRRARPSSAWPRSTACSSTSASPRCSSTCPSAASPTPTTRRSTCGWTAPTGPTAADVLNTYAAAELTRVLREYGEERFARKIAGAIVREPARREPFTTSARLVELLYAEIPAPARRTGGHPAKRTFQALRMEVNDELRGAAPGDPGRDRRDRRRRPGGRRVLPLARGPAGQAGVRRRDPQRRARTTCRSCPRATSRRSGWSPAAPRRPTPAEIAANPRAASVRLRAVERVRPDASREQPDDAAPHRSSAPRLPAARRGGRRAGPARPSSRGAAPRAPRVPFVTLVSLLLLGGVVGLLLFNTSMQQASFAATALEEQATDLSAREQTLQMELERLRDPQRVAEAAKRQGMVIPAGARRSSTWRPAGHRQRRAGDARERHPDHRAAAGPAGRARPGPDPAHDARRRRRRRRRRGTADGPDGKPGRAARPARRDNRPPPVSSRRPRRPPVPTRPAAARPRPRGRRGRLRGSPHGPAAGRVRADRDGALGLRRPAGPAPGRRPEGVRRRWPADEGTVDVVLPANRGDILDRNGEPLADSVDGLMVVADPTDDRRRTRREIATFLANRLDIDYFDTLERLRVEDSRFEYVARQVPSTLATRRRRRRRRARLQGPRHPARPGARLPGRRRRRQPGRLPRHPAQGRRGPAAGRARGHLRRLPRRHRRRGDLRGRRRQPDPARRQHRDRGRRRRGPARSPSTATCSGTPSGCCARPCQAPRGDVRASRWSWTPAPASCSRSPTTRRTTPASRTTSPKRRPTGRAALQRRLRARLGREGADRCAR